MSRWFRRAQPPASHVSAIQSSAARFAHTCKAGGCARSEPRTHVQGRRAPASSFGWSSWSPPIALLPALDVLGVQAPASPAHRIPPSWPGPPRTSGRPDLRPRDDAGLRLRSRMGRAADAEGKLPGLVLGFPNERREPRIKSDANTPALPYDPGDHCLRCTGLQQTAETAPCRIRSRHPA